VYSKEIFSLVTLELWHRIFLDGDRAEPETAAHIGAAEPVNLLS